MAPSRVRSPPSGHNRNWARRCERYCCTCISYFPLVFVYGLTTWALWVQVSIGMLPVARAWTGSLSASLALMLYVLLNWSYTVAVFTDPGSPLNNNNDYTALPSSESSDHTSLTVKSSGEVRFCKKCQTPKPDRAHHCSTCRRCVLKMDHHCPWLAACVGFRNYKPFLLFLIYTTFFCWLSFAASATWVWYEIRSGTEFEERLMPVNYILLAVLGGIIGLVLTGFTSWHVYLACRGQTTIESLEKTRYISPIRETLEPRNMKRGRSLDFGDQIREIHANTIPGVTRLEEGEERPSPTREWMPRAYGEREADRERQRYARYLDELDSEKLPNAFDLGWKRNLTQVFGEKRMFRWIPITNSTGDGWSWEISPRWIEARAHLSRDRENLAQHGSRQYNGRPQHLSHSGSPRELSNSFEANNGARQHESVTLQTLASQRSDTSILTKPVDNIPRDGSRQGQDYPTANWNDIPDNLLEAPREGLLNSETRARSPRPRSSYPSR